MTYDKKTIEPSSFLRRLTVMTGKFNIYVSHELFETLTEENKEEKLNPLL